MPDSTPEEWQGIPTYHTLSTPQLAHVSIGFIIHLSAVIFALFNFILFATSHHLRVAWHNWIVMGITIGDLLLNVFQGRAVIEMVAFKEWHFSDDWCQLQGFASALGGFISFNTVSLLTQERFHTVYLGKVWTGFDTLTRGIFTIGSAAAVSAIYFFGGNRYALQESGIYCGPDYGSALRPQPHPQLNRILSYGLCAMSFGTTLGVVVAYTSIWLSVRGIRKELRTVQKTSITTAEGEFSNGSSTQLEEDKAGKLREAEIAIKCATLVFFFLLAWMPYTLKVIYTALHAKPIPYYWDVCASLLAVTPGVSNPLVNNLMDRHWRKVSVDMVGRTASRCRKENAETVGTLASAGGTGSRRADLQQLGLKRMEEKAETGSM
ncbi:Melanopsin [Borealophlyctis nickersoniae]|nr:Melanopsin [Borealophlyctis nickersoniae]